MERTLTFGNQARRALVRIVLPDSGHLHEEEAAYANRRGYSKHKPALPLYTEDDAWTALDRLRPVHFDEDLEIVPGVRARFEGLSMSAWRAIPGFPGAA